MIFEQAFSKINLSLDITGRRSDGYHLVKMVMQTLDLCDELVIKEGEPGTGITLKVDDENLAKEQDEGSDNLVVKAAKRLFEYVKETKDVEIILSKHIPVAAGMAGGSSDAAATLRGLNRLFKYGLTNEELRQIAVKIGADVPFLIEGGLCLCEGIGEELTELIPLPSMPVVICKPNVFVSTKDVYVAYDSCENPVHPNVDGMLKAIEAYDYKTMSSFMGNSLEDVTKKMHPVIGNIEKDMLEAGAVNAMMSGSGPTVYGLFESNEAAGAAFLKMKELYPEYTVEVTRFHKTPRAHFE